MSRRLDLADIQGNVLFGFGLSWGWHQFVRIDDGAAGRAWLGEVAGRVSNAELKTPQPTIGLNLSLNASGLLALGVPRPVVAGFSSEFREGMVAQADVLGDRGPSDPSLWRSAFLGPEGGPPPPLAFVSVYAENEALRGQLRDRLRDDANRYGLAEVHSLEVRRLDQGREHFGFRDGIAQPLVAGAPRPPNSSRAGQGKPLPAGEFLLGHRDVEYAAAPGPRGPLGRNGTYLVYRELAQDVAGFRNYLDQQAQRTPLSPSTIAAKLVGRWSDGSPLVVTPDEPRDGNSYHRRDPVLNDFGYQSDPDGVRCPLGAHIRRVNPRDSLGFKDRLSRRHRMIRRGMSYGPPFEDDPEVERGLAFICLVASIRRQFEFVQSQWCNDGNAFGLGCGRDALVGRDPVAVNGLPPATMTVPGPSPHFLSPLPDVVTTKGGEYFFLPSLQGLQALAADAFREQRRTRLAGSG
jgi:Dyp-type peroxidase family